MQRRSIFALSLCWLLLLALSPVAAWAAPKAPPVTQYVKGTATSAGNGASLSGATVSLYTYNSKQQAWAVKQTATTSATGAYSFAVGVGAYRVGFAKSGFVTEYWNDKASVALADSITVASGQTFTANAALRSAFSAAGVTATQSGLNAVVAWTGGVAPFTVLRASNADFSDTVQVATTSGTSFTDAAPFRIGHYYSVTDATGEVVVSAAPLALVAGSGTDADPYLARCLSDLDTSRGVWSPRIRLLADIDAAATSDPASRFNNGGAGWAPLMNVTLLDGAGYTVSGLYINRPAEESVGLVGACNTVRDLHLVNVNVTGGRQVGGVAGFAWDVYGCSVQGSITGDEYVGGIAGHGRGTIDGCSADVNVVGWGYVGGINGAGSNSDGTLITNCTSSGRVTGSGACGGIVGDLNNGNVMTDCSSSCEVRGTNFVGGVAGYMYAGSRMERCSSAGDIYGTQGCGTLVGSAYYQDVIKDCVTTGDLHYTGWENGFLVGSSSEDCAITNCVVGGRLFNEASFSYGSIGGIVGISTVPLTIESSYYNSETGNVTTNPNGTPKTLAELQDPATYVGWDFENVWNLPVPGVSLPSLR